MTEFDANKLAHVHEQKCHTASTLKERQRILGLFSELISCTDLGRNAVYESMSIKLKGKTYYEIMSVRKEDKVHHIAGIQICAGCIRDAATRFRDAADHCDALVAMCTETE